MKSYLFLLMHFKMESDFLKNTNQLWDVWFLLFCKIKSLPTSGKN